MLEKEKTSSPAASSWGSLREQVSDFIECRECGDEFPAERWALGYRVCLFCGEDRAKAERKSWCVIQESTKQGYSFVTSAAARRVLLDTNPKAPRS